MRARYLELVRRGNAALNSDAWDVLFELLDPQIVWETTGEFAEVRSLPWSQGRQGDDR